MPAYGLGAAHGSIIITYDGAGVAKAEASVAKLDATTKRSGASMAAVGKSMAKGGAVIAAGLGLAVHSAAEFQSKMTLLVTAAGESPKALGMVSEGIKNIAIQTGTSLNDLAEGMYTVEKAGYRGAQGLSVLHSAAEGARAENVDMATFTSALTSVMTSYSYKASDSVRVTNMLVAAAGRSKTTMQEFAGSLATVLPVASALGVKFPQVAGAISVLTQHGTSAREATQELANMIRNLAGQNNVAKGALEQLGVNVIDLQKNLGKRGLTGTLDIVTDALRKHGKAGMIVTDALKHSTTAASSMNTMLGSMNKNVKTQSTALMNGKTSIKDYTMYAKGLGGQQGAMALQFLSLYKQSMGFSNALKSGNGRVATLASTLQKALGGATGMRTALQLGVGTMGESSKSSQLLAQNTRAIGDEFNKGGKDISTWAKTQQTATVQFGRMKAAGEVFAVNLGTVVLPVITTFVHYLTNIITALGSIPAPIRTVLGVGALLVAALLLLGSLIIKLVNFGKRLADTMRTLGRAFSSAVGAVRALLEKLGLIESAESRAAGAAEAAALRQEAASDATATAYEDAVLRIEKAQLEVDRAYEAQAKAADGSATEQENAALRVRYAQEGMATAVQEAEAKVAEAEAAEARAAQETATAVERAEAAKADARKAGAATAESAAATTSEAASAEATAVTTAAARERTAVGAGVGGAGVAGKGGMMAGAGGPALLGAAGAYLGYGEGKKIGKDAGNQGVGGAVGAVGGLGTFLGGKAASAIKGMQGPINDNQRAIMTLGHMYETVSRIAQRELVPALQDGGTKAEAASKSFIQQQSSLSGLTAKAKAAGLTQKDLTNAVSGSNAEYERTVRAWKAQGKPSANTLAQLLALRLAYQNVANKTADFNNKTLSVTGTAKEFNSRLNSVTLAIQKNGATLDLDTSFGQKNAAAIRLAADAAAAHAQAVYQQTGSLGKARSALATQRSALINAATAAGLSRTQVLALVSAELRIPRNITTHVHLDTGTINAQLDDLQARLGAIQNRTAAQNTVLSNVAHAQRHRSAGGWTTGQRYALSPDLVHGKEYVLSQDMLAGRVAVDQNVLAALSKSQISAMSSGGVGAAPVTSVQGGDVHVRVFIGDEEINDIVKVQVGQTLAPLSRYDVAGAIS